MTSPADGCSIALLGDLILGEREPGFFCERVNNPGQVDAGYLTCWILPSGQPEPCGHDARGQVVFDNVADISRRAGFATELAWQSDRVLVR